MMIFFLLNNSTKSRIKAAGVALAVGKKKGVERDGCSRNFFNYHVFVYHI